MGNIEVGTKIHPWRCVRLSQISIIFEKGLEGGFWARYNPKS